MYNKLLSMLKPYVPGDVEQCNLLVELINFIEEDRKLKVEAALDEGHDKGYDEIKRLRFVLAVQEGCIKTSALSGDQLRALGDVKQSIRETPRAIWGPLRCLLSEGSDGDTYAGCVLDEGHEGKCQMRARPQTHRAKAAAHEILRELA